MTDNTHGPPVNQALPGPMKIDEPPIPLEQLALLGGHEKYQRMRDRLGVEPLDLIRQMKHGGYRFKCRRGMPGVLVLDRAGDPVPERMSFRQVAPVLTAMSGVEVTYETVRRWWETVFDEGDEPEEEAPPPVPVVRRVTRRRTPVPEPVGDDHAQQIRAAVAKAAAPTTNPAVPPAAFLPPQE